MCGIFCGICCRDDHDVISTSNKNNCCGCNTADVCDKIRNYLERRGPTLTKEAVKPLSGNWIANVKVSVLWTQGAKCVQQPIQDDEGNFLLWNGDVLHGPLEHSDKCDSEEVFKWFRENPLSTVAKINGPYAFVFWHQASQRLWFGRDVLGRHSLLWSLSPNCVTLSSVAHKQGPFNEVPALGIFSADFSGKQVELEFFPWAHLPPGVCPETHLSITVRDEVSHQILQSGSALHSWLDREPKEEELAELPTSASFNDLLDDPTLSDRVNRLLDVLTAAVSCRVFKQPRVCQNCACPCDHCSVAVLFSGGIDSTLLALLAHKFVPEECPVDLYNVAFQQPDGGYRVPDRITGQASLEELRKLAPHRIWNFVEVNVSRAELENERSRTIGDLIHPQCSVLDDSLGCALWFASRGLGFVNGKEYLSPARVVLVGMGADEQLGGYTRHRTTLRQRGWAALGRELRADTDNIGQRNMGRDNRVIADHGRQPRTPFLDERVVAFLQSLPPWHRCMPMSNRGPGLGDKLLLRALAWRLGLRAAAMLPKRAMQFGSRIANSKEKGDQVSNRLK